jgi:ribonucleoside-diphosphate reductase alpha chain
MVVQQFQNLEQIEEILVLKNNKGTDDNRVRRLDYSIQITKLFWERMVKGEKISLFSTSDVPGLYDLVFLSLMIYI